MSSIITRLISGSNIRIERGKLFPEKLAFIGSELDFIQNWFIPFYNRKNESDNRKLLSILTASDVEKENLHKENFLTVSTHEHKNTCFQFDPQNFYDKKDGLYKFRGLLQSLLPIENQSLIHISSSRVIYPTINVEIVKYPTNTDLSIHLKILVPTQKIVPHVNYKKE